MREQETEFGGHPTSNDTNEREPASGGVRLSPLSRESRRELQEAQEALDQKLGIAFLKAADAR